MSEITTTASAETESSKPERNHKREADFERIDSAAKKSKTFQECGAGNREEESEKKKLTGSDATGGTKEGKSEISVKANGRNGDDAGRKVVTGSSGNEGKGLVIEADAAEDKGSRHTMEDAWVLLQDGDMDCPGKLRCAHFAIYDGHGGRLAAEYAKKHLHSNVLSAGLPLGCESC